MPAVLGGRPPPSDPTGVTSEGVTFSAPSVGVRAVVAIFMTTFLWVLYVHIALTLGGEDRTSWEARARPCSCLSVCILASEDT